jgi:hypothetical protein
MNWIEMQEHLSKSMSTKDMRLQKIAQKLDDINNMHGRGEISEEEYMELAADLEREHFINDKIDDLEGKAALAQLFDWAKSGISMIT